MSLSDLPDEILNLISIRLNGFDNCSLWMASDSKLKERLVNNVITDFDIKYTIPGRYLWPGNFLKRLQKLSRLSFTIAANAYHIPIANIEIFPIPTLKYLKLNFINFYQTLESKQLISSNHATGPTTSSSNRYINLNDYYSNLEHLEIINTSFEGMLSIDFLGCLPQKLKTLSLPLNTFGLDSPDPTNAFNTYIEMLPRTLSEIDFRVEYPFDRNAPLDFSKLPPNLTSLTTNSTVNDQMCRMVPKSLKSLSLLRNTCQIEKLSDFLPTGLESLSITIDAFAPHLLSKLPNLESLSLQPKTRMEMNYLINKCPPKLKTFICNNLILTNLPVPGSLFSHCLTKLILNRVVGITPEFISSLPRSLTELEMSEQGHQPFPFFSLLPRNLKSLVVNFDLVENISLLPENLECLRLTSPNSSDISYFDQFPRQLERLTIAQNIPISVLKQMPAGLTELHVFCVDTIEDEVIRTLPRGLKEFSAQGPDNITDAAVADLPPCLEYFLLVYNTKLTDHAIALLPRSLTQLNLPENTNLTDKCIKHLPRNFVNLCLNSATAITSNSCEDLPKYMEVLSLPRCNDWDPQKLIASKNELPPFLRNISLGNPAATDTWCTILKDQKSFWKSYQSSLDEINIV